MRFGLSNVTIASDQAKAINQLVFFGVLICFESCDGVFHNLVFCLAPKVIENGSVVYIILQEKSKKFVFLVKSMVAGR